MPRANFPRASLTRTAFRGSGRSAPRCPGRSPGVSKGGTGPTRTGHRASSGTSQAPPRPNPPPVVFWSVVRQVPWTKPRCPPTSGSRGGDLQANALAHVNTVPGGITIDFIGRGYKPPPDGEGTQPLTRARLVSLSLEGAPVGRCTVKFYLSIYQIFLSTSAPDQHSHVSNVFKKACIFLYMLHRLV